MKRIYLSAVFYLIVPFVFCQTQPVVLSGLKVTMVIDASSPESNCFLVELNVSDPSTLARLEVAMEDSDNRGKTTKTFYHVKQNERNVELLVDTYAVPFEGQIIRFFVKAHDQLKAPFHKIVIEGYDKNNRITNRVVYNQ